MERDRQKKEDEQTRKRDAQAEGSSTATKKRGWRRAITPNKKAKTHADQRVECGCAAEG